MEGYFGSQPFVCLQASSEHSVCFAVPMKEADTVRRALEQKFRRDLDAGRLSKVTNLWSNERLKS